MREGREGGRKGKGKNERMNKNFNFRMEGKSRTIMYANQKFEEKLKMFWFLSNRK